MGYYRYTPPPPLDRFVEVLWVFQGAPGPHKMERLLPDGSVELVVNLRDSRIPVYNPHDITCYETFPPAVVCGPHSQFFVIDTASQMDVVGVHFRPGGAYPFLKLPTAEIRNLHVGLDALWGRDASELRNRLLEARTPQAKVRVLQESLLAKAALPERHPAVAFALGQFHSSPEARKMSDVTQQIGLSAKRFIDVFQKEVGLTPKLFCRVRRFQRMLRVIGSGRPIDWAEIALTGGYFDQAHFIHDFRAFSGISPSVYLADHIEHFNHVPIRS